MPSRFLSALGAALAVILAMIVYLRMTGRKLIDKSQLSAEELAYERTYPLWRALSPWLILVLLILALNVPKEMFNYLYRELRLPINGLTANGAPLETRALWQAYTWILASTLLAIPLWIRRSSAIFPSAKGNRTRKSDKTHYVTLTN